MIKPKLNPCPFCGGKAVMYDAGELYTEGRFSAYCPECLIYFSLASEKEAAEAWNRRASGWIPVSERCPIVEGKFIVYTAGIDVTNARTEIGYFDGKNWDSERIVIAWMPLPEPYEVGK